MPHYYDASPAGEERHDQATLHIDGRDFSFVTSSGVFASHRVDFGTQLLLETVIEQIRAQGVKNGRLLDLGCGYGVVGVVMKRFFPAMDVVMADVNARAVRLAGDNAKRNQVAFAQIVQSDGFAGLEGMFDHILTNPPVRAGKTVVHSFFDGAYEHLTPGGRPHRGGDDVVTGPVRGVDGGQRPGETGLDLGVELVGVGRHEVEKKVGCEAHLQARPATVAVRLKVPAADQYRRGTPPSDAPGA